MAPGKLNVRRACVCTISILASAAIGGQLLALRSWHGPDGMASPVRAALEAVLPAGGGAADRTIPVFYNVFTQAAADGPQVRAIVDEQLARLRPEHDVRVRAIGAAPSLPPRARLVRHDAAGTEVDTLDLLWEHCQDPAQAARKVVYLHSKGSYHPSLKNRRLRRFLTRGALSRECAALPDTCDVCSSRMSPVPHPHTSGNMWLARCDYVRRLARPSLFRTAMDQVANYTDIHETPDGGGRKGLAENWSPCIGRGRFSAEHWIYSHPTVRPCDLSTSSYVWNYKFVPEWEMEDALFDLRPAPRFALEQYRVWKTCGEWGFSLRDRLTEYRSLYGEAPSASWWGWKLFNVDYEEVGKQQ